ASAACRMALPSWPAFDSSSTYARSMTPIRLCAEPTAPSAKTKAKPNSVATTIRLFNPSASRLRVQRCSRGVPRHSLSVHHRLGLPCFLLLFGRKCKKRLPKEALPSYACVGGLLRRRHRHVERIRRTAGGELLLLRLLQTLPETGLHLLGGLLNESLLRGCDHAADHVAAHGAVDAGRHVTQVTLIILNAQLRRHFLLQLLQRLLRVGHQNGVALLACGHVVSPPRCVLCAAAPAARLCECWEVWQTRCRPDRDWPPRPLARTTPRRACPRVFSQAEAHRASMRDDCPDGDLGRAPLTILHSFVKECMQNMGKVARAMSCRVCGRPLSRAAKNGVQLCRMCDDRVMERAEKLLLRRRTAAEPDWERQLALARDHRRSPVLDFFFW